MVRQDIKDDVRSILGKIALGLAGLGLAVSACSSGQGGIVVPGGADAAGDGGSGAGGDPAGPTSGSGGSTPEAGGAGGSETTDGGTSAGGAGGGAGTGAGGSSTDGGQLQAACVFHTAAVWEGGLNVLPAASAAEGGVSDPSDAEDPIDAAAEGGSRVDALGDAAPSTEAGPRADAGASGDAGPAPSITVGVSAFVGPYLADSAGRTLYTYGADMPGDCKYAPISGCEKDCLIAWPLFEAGARTLAPGLDDAAFGTILRADGATQTTYYGWPLYYYKTDLTPGTFAGQAKAKTWHAATVIPVGIVIMKGVSAAKYLADGAGRTLYTFDGDAKGTVTSDPVPACNEACLAAHPAFQRNRLSVVSSLEPTDFTVFVRSGGSAQLAYRGAPLYSSAADERSGDVKGATTGWSIAVP